VTIFLFNVYAPDPEGEKLTQSFEREVRLERKLLILNIIFWLFAVIFLASIVLAIIYTLDFWILLFALAGQVGLLRLFSKLINRTKEQVDAECIIQKNLRLSAVSKK